MWHMIVMEDYCVIRNEEEEDIFRKYLADLYELMQSDMRRTKRSLCVIIVMLE